MTTTFTTPKGRTCTAQPYRLGDPQKEESCIRSLAVAFAATITMLLPAGADAKPGCQTERCHQRVQKRHWHQTIQPYKRWLLATAACESGRRWHISGNGYSGGMQFTPSSWAAVGGRRTAGEATALEQMFRAVLLRRIQGVSSWPVCGH